MEAVPSVRLGSFPASSQLTLPCEFMARFVGLGHDLSQQERGLICSLAFWFWKVFVLPWHLEMGFSISHAYTADNTVRL